MDRVQKAFANAKRLPSSITASLGRGLCPAGLRLSIQPLVTKYGQTPAEVLQYCPPGTTFALEPESSSSRPLQGCAHLSYKRFLESNRSSLCPGVCAASCPAAKSFQKFTATGEGGPTRSAGGSSCSDNVTPQAGEWRGRMHTAEYRVTALQQLVHHKEQTIQQLQTAAIPRGKSWIAMMPQLCIH